MSATPIDVPQGYDTLLEARVQRALDAAAELLDAVRMVPGGTGVLLVDATDWLIQVVRGQSPHGDLYDDMSVAGDHLAGAA